VAGDLVAVSLGRVAVGAVEFAGTMADGDAQADAMIPIANTAT
jgi:hypothetical protein